LQHSLTDSFERDTEVRGDRQGLLEMEGLGGVFGIVVEIGKGGKGISWVTMIARVLRYL